MLERLHKVLARAGVAALRPAEDMIMAGRVTVNGRVVRELGARVDPETDAIAVDGQLIEPRQPADPYRYVIVNKPVGVISTAYDTHRRPTVVGLVPTDARLFPVGRLDADSEGLILLTDDGDLAYRLTHPRFEVEKEYRVLLNQTPKVEDLRRWREGVELDDEMTMPAWVEVLDRTPDGTWVRVVMREGRKRQIREVARLLGYEVLRLIRVREGSLVLGDLQPGQWRELTSAEVQSLRAHTQHVPSRAADEERERRMSDRDRPEGRRLRVIRGSRRSTTVDEAPPSEPVASQEPFARRARAYTVPAQPEPERTSTGRTAAPRERSSRSGVRGEATRGGFNDRQPSRDTRRDQQRTPNSHAEQARRQPRTADGRADETGRRNRDVGNRYGSSRGPQRSFNDRSGSSRSFSDRGGPRRTPDDRGPQRSFNDRGGRAYDSRRTERDYRDQRAYGPRGPQLPNDDRRGRALDNERDADTRREYGPRTDRPRSGERSPRDYGQSRSSSPRDRPPRDYDERRERSFEQRDSGGRSSSGQRQSTDDRRNRPTRPGDPPRNRGGYGRRPDEERRRGPENRGFGGQRSSGGERREGGAGGGGSNYRGRTGGPSNRSGGSTGRSSGPGNRGSAYGGRSSGPSRGRPSSGRPTAGDARRSTTQRRGPNNGPRKRRDEE